MSSSLPAPVGEIKRKRGRPKLMPKDDGSPATPAASTAAASPVPASGGGAAAAGALSTTATTSPGTVGIERACPIALLTIRHGPWCTRRVAGVTWPEAQVEPGGRPPLQAAATAGRRTTGRVVLVVRHLHCWHRRPAGARDPAPRRRELVSRDGAEGAGVPQGRRQHTRL